MIMWILVPLLIVLAIAIFYEYRNKKKTDVHLNSNEYKERPSQRDVTDEHQSQDGSQPPPT